MPFTVNGVQAIKLDIHLPRTGIWHIDFEADTEAVSTVSGAVSVVAAGLTLTGTTLRADAWRGRVVGRVRAGAGGMGTVLPPLSYTHASVRGVAVDILSGAGEKLSGTASLSGTLTAWVRQQATAKASLRLLSDDQALTWRALPDGTHWLGTETYPAAVAVGTVDTIDYRPDEKRYTLGVDGPWLLPGTSYLGGNVDRVWHHVEADTIRTEVWLDG